MKINFTNKELAEITKGKIKNIAERTISTIYYDTRLIISTEEAAFFALSDRRNGHDFVFPAYEKGIRTFIVSEAVNLPDDATIITVENPLRALQQVAKHHRQQFSYPVLAITGSLGKTTIKEWLYFLLSNDYAIVRSPKSFNSQLGVALSLLEMTENHDLAIIEADISHPGEMDFIEEMVAPTLGIYTGIGHFYADNFPSQEIHAAEHLKLFQGCNLTFALEKNKRDLRKHKIQAAIISDLDWKAIDFSALSYPDNRKIALAAAEFLGIEKSILQQKVKQLPSLPNRMEVFEGIDNNLIINDSYNVDIDALEQALAYQFSSKEREDKIVVLDLSFVDDIRRQAILNIVQSYQPKKLFIIENHQIPEKLMQIKNASILFKGSYRSRLKEIVLLFKNRKHETWVEFDLRAMEHNLRTFQSKLPQNTKILVMVKASTYGSGDANIPHFLQQLNVDYLGVAYIDEGATLRENGITLPILVMNTEKTAFDDLIKFQLEPTLSSFEQLEDLHQKLKQKNIHHFPVHISIETGMNRLGFYPNDIPQLIEKLKSIPEIKVKSVYSHLADADNFDETFSQEQILKFKAVKAQFQQWNSEMLFHILNSEGTSKFGKIAAFDMVRLGIGIFGYTSTAKEDSLRPTLKWKTTVSQTIQLKPGDTVGYNRLFHAEKSTQIATIRIGYADGFRRSLSNGIGSVFINGVECPVVGNICMDMTMVNVTHLICEVGDEVEIIGENIDIHTFSERLQTTPYEVMTSIGRRVSRVYLR